MSPAERDPNHGEFRVLAPAKTVLRLREPLGSDGGVLPGVFCGDGLRLLRELLQVQRVQYENEERREQTVNKLVLFEFFFF